MAETTLRAYIKEIDDLVENDQLDEAIAHCRHILQTYPKHLSTYRLLGKAYLEAKRYGDAADIFQRVLSAVPDDFVAQIGMAIVREDEGNLDSAIWHMERAYETNPANPAIRQELSRLIGRRDGLEPHKIRLTRGALARQYAHGELYPQAIAELRSALKEVSDRPDLQVLLAQMYWRTDQQAEAIDLCNRILDKLPFCREANRILAAILQASDKGEEASDYHRRLAGLDPYVAFVESASIDPRTVDANSVRIEKSEWAPGQPLPHVEPGQPEWVASLGVNLSAESADAPAPSRSKAWLDDLKQDTSDSTQDAIPTVSGTASGEPAQAEQAGDGSIPEWMREAGWQDSTGEAVEGPVSYTDEELERTLTPETPASEEPEELAPAEIPDWIQDMSPEEAEAIGEADLGVEDGVAEGALPGWLGEIAADADDVVPDPSQPIREFPDEPQEVIPDQPEIAEAEPDFSEEITEPLPQGEAPEVPKGEAPEVPTWIEEDSPGATSTIITWLGDKPRAEDETSPEEVQEPVGDEAATVEPAEVEAGLPDWLEDAEPLEEEDELPAPAAETKGPPAWLDGVAEAASQQDIPLPTIEEPEAEVEAPEQIAEAESEIPAPSEPELEAEVPEPPNWLMDIAEPGEALQEEATVAEASEVPEEIVAADPEQVDKLAPDWLAEIGETEKPIQDRAESEVPDWLSGIAEPETAEGAEPFPEELEPSGTPEEIPEIVVSPDKPTVARQAPDWLREFAAAADLEPPAPLTADETAKEPAQVSQADIVSDLEPIIEAPQPGTEEPVRAPGLDVEEDLDDDEVYRWLEGLAARQGADEAELVTTPEERPIEPPAGVSDVEQQPTRQGLPPEEPEESIQWLEELAAKRGIDADLGTQTQPKLQGEDDTDTPEWLHDTAVEPGAETVVARSRYSEATEEVEEVASETESDVESVDQVSTPPPIEELEIEAPDWLADPVADPIPPDEVIQETAESELGADPDALISEPIPPGEPKIEPPPEDLPISPPQEGLHPESREDVEPPSELPEAEEGINDSQELLENARNALAEGNFGQATRDYGELVKRKYELGTIIDDLKTAIERDPKDPSLWQALGDAYMKSNNLSDAINAYQQGTEVA